MQEYLHAPRRRRQAQNKRAGSYPQGRPNGRAHADDPFAAPTINVARRLIGARLERIVVRGGKQRLLSGRIVETEAYLPNVDPACHGYRGPTARTASLFGRPGNAYVYLIYGVHWCFNVVTERPGIGAAVLVRALEPLEGLSEMRRLRGPGVPEHALASGPGNLCRAMAIDRTCDGVDLRTGALRIVMPQDGAPQRIAVTTRVGLSTARAWPLRFYDPHSVSVSRRPRSSSR